MDDAIRDFEIALEEFEEEYLGPVLSESSGRRPADSTARAQREDPDPHRMAEERELISRFLATPCPCGSNCQGQFSVSELLESRENFRLMSWTEQHSFIVGKLQTFMRVSKHAVSARATRMRERAKYDYYVNADRPVCRETFLFYHGESIDRLKRRQKYLSEVGTLPPEHGNTGRKPKHACKPTDKDNVDMFIQRFAAIHGLPDPGRDLRAGKGRLKVYLPTVMNYRSVHRVYEKSMSLHGADAVTYQTFRRIWVERFPNIVFSKTKSDLCMTCEDNKKLINASIASGDEEYKLECLARAEKHLLAAKRERDYYRESIQQSTESYQRTSARRVKGRRKGLVMHYSWDFAQQLHVPYEDHQVGPLYFKSPRVAQLFGVCCEALPQQVNYLIDEADFTDKGADTVISLLDHYFEHHGLNEDHALLSADNCVGQNKNNAVIQYLMYRTMTGKHRSMVLSFMLVGHTKFSPDGFFGLIKKRYRRSRVYTYEHLVEVINSSTNRGFNVCQPYTDHQGRGAIPFRKWSSWLSRVFNNIPGITNYQHFRVDADTPGIITVKQSIDAKEETFCLLKDKSFRFGNEPKHPPSIRPQRLSAERQWYLYEAIRPHIPDEKDKDATAPKPRVPKPKRKRIRRQKMSE